MVIPFVALWQLLRPPTIELTFPFDTVLGFLEDAFGGVLGLAGFAIDKLEDALRAVWEPLAQGVVDVIAGFHSVIGQIADGFVTVGDWIRSVAQNAYDQFIHLYDTLGGIIANTFQAAISAGGVIWDFVYGAVNDGIENILGTFSEFWNTVTNIVNQALQDAFDGAGWLWDWLTNAVTQIVTAIIGTGAWLWNLISGFAYDWLMAVLRETDSLWDWVSEHIIQPLVDAALAVFGDIISVVLGAWDFLVFVAEHPLTWFTDQFDQVFADGASPFIDALGRAIDDEQGPAVDFLDRIFG